MHSGRLPCGSPIRFAGHGHGSRIPANRFLGGCWRRPWYRPWDGYTSGSALMSLQSWGLPWSAFHHRPGPSVMSMVNRSTWPLRSRSAPGSPVDPPETWSSTRGRQPEGDAQQHCQPDFTGRGNGTVGEGAPSRIPMYMICVSLQSALTADFYRPCEDHQPVHTRSTSP